MILKLIIKENHRWFKIITDFIYLKLQLTSGEPIKGVDVLTIFFWGGA